ncbi:MAG: glycerol-3-phosphate 1-O-acyltransferase PlsY [Bacteroides sp.]|jgi:glycerol-3-phosphate acyltransferase PlsY|nr:glycerol-3-phosphate 1-O-acyltransferase PlsY [Bacteroides sp.]
MEFHWGMLLCLAGAYLLGSIPTAVWIGKAFFGIDVREHGSGNAGATNALRVLGTKTGIVVLLLDALKGVAAVALGWLVGDAFSNPDLFSVFQLFLGLFALLGHVFPLFAGFRGGKGIATLAGIVTILFPGAILICLAVFLAFFLPTRYVSLGSIAASLTFPVAVIGITGPAALPEIIFSLLVAIFVPLTHRKNIQRLFKGRENRIVFRKK